MNHWDILQIEPTSDQTTIRRAYAKILKTIDQESHPEQFIQLREAYTWAIRYGSVYLEDEDGRTDDRFDPSAPKSGLSKCTTTLTEQPIDDSNLIHTTPQPIDKTKQNLFDNIDALEDLINSGGSLEFASTGFCQIIEDLKAIDLDTQMQLNDRIEDILASHHSAELHSLLLIWQKHIGIDELHWSDRNARKILHERLYPTPSNTTTKSAQDSATDLNWSFIFFMILLLHFAIRYLFD